MYLARDRSGARRCRRRGPDPTRPPSLSPIATRQLASDPGPWRLPFGFGHAAEDSGVRRSIMTPPPPGGTLREWLVIPTLARPLPLANQWLAGCCLLACLIIFYPAGGMSLLVAVTVSKHSSWITLPGVSRLSQ